MRSVEKGAAGKESWKVRGYLLGQAGGEWRQEYKSRGGERGNLKEKPRICKNFKVRTSARPDNVETSLSLEDFCFFFSP